MKSNWRTDWYSGNLHLQFPGYASCCLSRSPNDALLHVTDTPIWKSRRSAVLSTFDRADLSAACSTDSQSVVVAVALTAHARPSCRPTYTVFVRSNLVTPASDLYASAKQAKAWALSQSAWVSQTFRFFAFEIILCGFSLGWPTCWQRQQALR